jgi:DnaK suppressor protein
MPSDSLDPAAIDRLRGLLREKKRDLETRIDGGGDAARPVELDQQSVGRVSRAEAIQQQQMALAGRQQAIALLRRVDQALQRIDDADFGHCQECGEAIAEARLRVQPWASLCIDCQSASEAGE